MQNNPSVLLSFFFLRTAEIQELKFEFCQIKWDSNGYSCN